MAIVRSQEGHFFEVPDEELKKYTLKQEDIPESAKANPDLTQGTGMGPMGSGGGGQGVSPVQIIVNYMGGMGGGGMGGGPQGGEGQAQGAEAGAAQGQGQKQDVGGRYCGHWHNCWRNCWRNYWRNFSW